MESSDSLMGTVEQIATVESAEELEEAVGARGIPARPLLGVLPLARVVPQDVHSMMDYAGGVALVASGLMAETTTARVAGLALGGALIGASLVTDYRLSLAKLIPIEVHEVLDLLTAGSAIAAPLALGYSRRSKAAAITQIAVGVTELVGSLLTDYRAAEGRGRRQFAT